MILSEITVLARMVLGCVRFKNRVVTKRLTTTRANKHLLFGVYSFMNSAKGMLGLFFQRLLASSERLPEIVLKMERLRTQGTLERPFVAVRHHVFFHSSTEIERITEAKINIQSCLKKK